MSTITKLEVNLSERYIPPEPTPEEPEEGSKEWCEDHLEDPRCEQYRPVDPDDPVDPTPEEPEEGSEEWCEIHTDSELCKEQEEDNEETSDAPDTGHYTILSVGDNNNTPTSTPFFVAGAAIALLVLVACFAKFFKRKKEDKNHYCFKQQKGYKKAYATILPVLSLALIAGIFARVFAYNYDVYPDLAASENLTIDNADIIGTDEIRYVKDTLVLPKSNYGYELYIHADNNKLTSDYNQGIYLDPVASTGALTENTFGYTFVNPATNPNTFERLSQTAERIITKAYSPEQTKDGISLDIWWGVNAKSAEEANYELEISYDLHEQQIITELQDMTPEICADMPTDHYESFIDIRNNKTYQVYKDNFGRCNVEGVLTHDEGGNPTIEPISRDQFPDLDPEESICPTGWHEVEIPATETTVATTGCAADYENIEVIIFDIDEDGNIVFNGSETIDLDDERCEGWTCTFIAPAQPEGAEPGQEFYGWSTEKDPEITPGDEKTGKYQPGEEILIDSPNFTLYPIWEQKTPKAILNDKNYLEFVYDYYSVEESKEPEYRAIYEPTLEDGGEIYEVYSVPVNATLTDRLNIPSSYQGGNEKLEIKYIDFDESFKDFEPTSTYRWFERQIYLESVSNMQNLNLSRTTDTSSMFENVEISVSELDLSSLDMPLLKNASNMFNCMRTSTDVLRLNLSGWQLGETNLSNMFYNFGAFNENSEVEIDITDWDVSKAKNMTNMFAFIGTYARRDYDVHYREVEKVKLIGLESWDTSSVENMSGMFEGIINLEGSIDLSNWNTSNARDMSYMFSDIDIDDAEFNLSNWVIPSDNDVSYIFKTNMQNSDEFIFKGLETWDTSEATSFAYLFAEMYGPNADYALDLSGWNTANVESLEKTFYHMGTQGNLIVKLKDESSNESSGWDTSSVKNMDYTFSISSLNQALSIVGFEDFDTSSVETMQSTFENFSCSQNEDSCTIDLSAWDMSNVKTTNSMFADLESNQSRPVVLNLDWGETTKNIENMSSMFSFALRNSEEVQIIGLSEWNTGSVISTSDMFALSHEHADFTYDLSKWTMSNNKNISDMFECTGVASSFAPDLHGWDLQNVTGNYSADAFSCSFGVEPFQYVSSKFAPNVKDWHVENMTDMSKMFDAAGYNAKEFSLDLTGWNTESVTNLSDMFHDAGGNSETWTLKGISGFKTDLVTNMSSMFSYAGSSAVEISNLDLSNWNVKTTSFRYMFNGSGFKDINLSGWNSGQTDLELNTYEMFAGSKAETINLSGWGEIKQITNPYTSGRGMFQDALNLSTIYADSDWKLPDNDKKMFIGDVNLPEYDESRVSSLYARVNGYEGEFGYFVNDNPRFAKLIYTEDRSANFVYDANNYTVGDIYTYSIDGTTVLSSTIEGVYNVPKNAEKESDLSWMQCNKSHVCQPTIDIITANFDTSFKDFSPLSTAYWFSSEISLLTIANLQNLNTNRVSNMKYMFAEAFDYPSSLNIPNGFGKNAKNMESMFDSTYLESLVFPADFGSKATNMKDMFRENIHLKSLTFSAGFGAEATYMNNMFINCSELQEITLPSGFGANASELNDAFNNTALREISLPSGFGARASNLSSIFSNTPLREIVLPSGFGSQAHNIMGMFSDMGQLKTIYADADLSGKMLLQSKSLFEGSINLVGGAGTTYDSLHTDKTYARIDRPDLGQPGYFTDICQKYGTCATESSTSSEPAPVFSNGSAYVSSDNLSENTESETEPEEKPVSTTKDKKSTKKSDTKSGQTEPLGVKKSVEKTSTVDTAVVAVIVASFVLVSAGAVIIFLIEKRRNEDEE